MISFYLPMLTLSKFNVCSMGSSIRFAEGLDSIELDCVYSTALKQ